MGLDGQRPKELCRIGSKENVNVDGDSFQAKPPGKTLNKQGFITIFLGIKLPTAFIAVDVDMNHFRNHLATVGLCQVDISCTVGRSLSLPNINY